MEEKDINVYERVNRRIMVVVCVVVIVCMLAAFVIYIVRSLTGDTANELPKSKEAVTQPVE